MPKTQTPRILVTGFEPFGAETTNPSAQIIQRLEGESVDGAIVCTGILPVVRGRAVEELLSLIEKTKPVAVVTLGQAAGRAGLSLERVAINCDDFPIPDNEGWQPQDELIIADGPDAYFSTLPIKPMLAALHRKGIAAHISNTAGTYVCNHVFYGLQHALKDDGIPSGFIHVPLTPEQASLETQPSMPLAVQIEGVKAALEAIIQPSSPSRLVTGKIC